MKRAIYFLVAIALFLSSCEPLADIYDELEANDTGYSNSLAYTLTADDYEAIADMAANPSDASFISNNMFFTDNISAADNIPDFLADKYPALSEGSTAMITYAYSGAVPENYEMYTDPDDYEIGVYTSIDGILDVTKYFSPSYPPEVYIPLELADSISGPSNGDLILVEYEYSDVDPKVDFASLADITVWEESFNGSLGNFTAYDITGAQDWYSTGYGEDEYAKMSGYSSGAQDNEDWLVSSAIDLTGETDISLVLRQATNYVSGAWENLTVLVSTDFSGDVATATWDELTLPNMPTGSDWTFVESGKVDLSSYIDETIYIAFKYLSSSVSGIAATWEVDWAKIVKPGTDPPIIGKDPETFMVFYEFNGSWGKAGDVYNINAVDYNAMGSPGSYDNFSSSDAPGDYIPTLLKNKFPLAGPDSEVVVVYKYYTGISGVWTITIASTYTFKDGTWVSDYNYVDNMTSQFLYSDGNWVFDPTVIFTMKGADYQAVVDYVGANIGGSYVDSYGTAEFYTGAGSYYSNYDGRAGKWDDSVFSTWQDALEYSIGSILLPVKFPDAVTQVSGIDVFYMVTFATYDGSNATLTWTFQCTKSGPNPEFTKVD